MPWHATACRCSGDTIASVWRKFVCADAVGMPSQLQLTDARVLLQLPWECHGRCSLQIRWGNHCNCRPEFVYRVGGDTIVAAAGRGQSFAVHAMWMLWQLQLADAVGIPSQLQTSACVQIRRGCHRSEARVLQQMPGECHGSCSLQISSWAAIVVQMWQACHRHSCMFAVVDLSAGVFDIPARVDAKMCLTSKVALSQTRQTVFMCCMLLPCTKDMKPQIVQT